MSTINPSQWVTLYADYLLRYATYRLNDVERCRDLVQDTFLSALKAKDQFQGNSSEKTWLTTILKNKIVDEYRKQNRKPIDELVSEDTTEGTFFGAEDSMHEGWRANQVPKFWEHNVLDRLEEKEYHAVLQYCIRKLKSNHAEILMEKFMAESSSEKICKDFGISKSNYWVILHRVYLQLRKCLELNWYLK
jgi:RNA polymerase sigma-70 factor (TIGR02943 family)